MDDNKKRRSSILKVKARKPFGDLCNDDETEDTVTRARRVSFAASNQVKKFTALGEQHTIWDSTYEESVEGSDHSPSSLQLQSTQSCTINKENIKISENLDVTTIPNITLEMAHSNQRQFKEHEIKTVEITKVVDKENKNVRIKTTEHQTIITDKTVEFTQMNRTNYVGDDMEMSRMDSKQVLPENVYQPSTVCDSFMELTTMIPGLIVTHQVQDMSLDDTLDPGIEFTMPVQGNIQEKLKDESFTMDFITPLPVRMNIIQGTGETSEKTENNYEMEFTRPIPLNIIQETDVKEKIYSPIDMELTKPVNFTINQINDMEFTEVVGALNDYEMERTKAVGGNIMGPADVENCELDFTKAVGGNIYSRENKLLNEGDDKVLCESLVKNVQSVSEGNSIFESETLKSFQHTETKNKIVEQDKENVLSNTENLNMSLEKSLFVSDCAESSKSNSKLILSTCNKSKIESKIENALIKESVKEIVKHDSAVTSKMSANIDIPSSKFKFETAEVSNYLSEKDLIITESTESSKSDQTPFKSEDKIKIKKKMIKSEVVSHENVSTTSKNTTNTNTANIKENVSSNLPCERANIFNNHLDKTSFNPRDKTIIKTEMIKSEVVSCENVPETSKNTTNTNTANIKENVSSNLPCERANIFNNQLDKTYFNLRDKAIIKTEMIKSEVVSSENVPTTSKNTTNTNTANIKENVCPNLASTTDLSIISKTITDINIANIKDDVSSNLVCKTAQNLFDKSPAVLQDIKISTSQLLPACNKSKIETETTAAASTNLLEMSKSSIIILNNTDMTMDNNPEHHVTPSQTCLKDSANLSKTNMDLTDNSLTAKQSINKNLKAVECKAQTHKERKTIDAKSLITPECKKHRFRPSKHASETPLTPVVSAKKKRETPQLPRKPKLFGENNKSLQAIEERPAENEQSLHYLSHCTINSANSSNYDDTNHLINYNISGGKSRSNCKSDFSKIVLGENMSFPDLVNMPLGVNSPSFHVSLNDTTNKSRADITTELSNSHSENSHLENMLDNTRPPDFLIDMSASISDSVIVEEPKTMLDRILSESLSLLNEKKEDVLKIDLDQSKRIQDKFCWLFRKLSENIKREIEECRNSLSTSDTTFDDCSTGESTYEGSFTKNLIKEEVAQKSILDKINDLFKRNGKQSKWSLLSSEETTHTFATLYKTIIFTVHLNAEIVKDIKLENQLSKTVVRPDALYTHQIFMEKLSLKNIQKSLGEKFDIISLLDYVQLTMLNITDLRKELQYLFDTYGAILEDDFKLRFSIIRIERMFVWNFAINMRELEPVNEKTVEYFAKIGTPRNELIQVCSAGCPNGVPFARQFIQNLYAYVDKKNHK